MPESVTIARPYAKAIFEHALEKKQLSTWDTYLQILANAISEEEVSEFISNPASDVKQHQELLVSLLAKTVSKDDEKELSNFICMLAENGRLLVLPEIFLVFKEMRAQQEKKLEVTVTTCAKLSKEQQQALIKALENRLEREVSLKVLIDKETLIGGTLIRAGDMVIDGSIRGKLDKLHAALIA